MSDLISRTAVMEMLTKVELSQGITTITDIKLNLREIPTIYDTNKVEESIRFKEYFDNLYGEGLEVQNYHLNGDTEPFDNFYDSALDFAKVGK